MTGAQALIESLLQEQVDHIFGYAGATICPIVDVLRTHPEIGYTLVRTEQNAGHMASGYARVSGKVGVCMVTSGPGATNLITGIATAYMDSIPMVAITGQVPSHLLGRDIFQEVDITGAVAPFSKHSYLVKNANDIPRIVKEAFHIASTGRPGPVLIDVPIDILFTDAACREYIGRGMVTVDRDVLLSIPDESIVPYNIESMVSAICVSGTYLRNNVFELEICVTVVLKVLAKVEVLVPSYGYCEVPPCEEFADSVCDEFFSLPLFPQAVCDEDALRARNVSCTCGNYASSTGLGCATTATGMGCAGTCGCKC